MCCWDRCETAQTGWCTGRTGPGLWIRTVGEGQSTQGEGACFSRPQLWCDSSAWPSATGLPASLSVSFSLTLSLPLHPCFLLILSSVPPFPFPDVPAVIQAPFTSIIWYYSQLSVLSLPSLRSSHLHHLNFLFLFVKQLSSHNIIFAFYISLTFPLISSISSSLCPSDGPSLPLCFPPSFLFRLPSTSALQWLYIWVSLLSKWDEM